MDNPSNKRTPLENLKFILSQSASAKSPQPALPSTVSKTKIKLVIESLKKNPKDVLSEEEMESLLRSLFNDR